MNRKRLFKLFAALALLVAIMLVVSMATASQPDSVVRDPRYDQGPRYNPPSAGTQEAPRPRPNHSPRPRSYNPPSAGTQEAPHVGDNEQAVGLAIYRQSERGLAMTPALRPNASGLAIYHESEWNRTANPGMLANEAGLTIYRQSERSRIAKNALNAYQRSEWLGADR